MRSVSSLRLGLTVMLVCSLAWVAAAQQKKLAPAPVKPPATKESPKPIVNINNATEKELQLLPRVGPKLAAAIVAYRKEHGNFKELADLKKVKGIGDKNFETLKPYLTLTGPTTLKEKVKVSTKATKKTDKAETKTEKKPEESTKKSDSTEG